MLLARKHIFILLQLLISLSIVGLNLPKDYQQLIQNIYVSNIGVNTANISSQAVEGENGMLYVNIEFDLNETIKQDDWQVNITPAFSGSFHWTPHLTPKEGNIIDQHVFRAPSIIASNSKKGFIIIPDIDKIKDDDEYRWYMDLDVPNNKLTLGLSKTKVSDHVLFERTDGCVFPKGTIEFGFYIIKLTSKNDLANPFRKPLDFFWRKWGHDLFVNGHPITGNLKPYVEHTYNWAFNTWKKSVWQEFEIDGKKLGAPVFIVNTTQSPNYPGEVNEREFRSIWNQAWFNSLRSASGLYRFARREANDELLNKALLTKELALSYPQKSGFFYSVIATEMEQIGYGSKVLNRSRGWDTYYWGNSNRNPYTWDPHHAPFHVLDMSWTALLMLRWYDELEKDERLLKYVQNYADALLQKQYPNGFFPGWIDVQTLEPMTYLNKSPETSMSVTFLLKLFDITKDKKYKTAALKAMKAVMHEILPSGRWEDFETYWSCCRVGTPDWVGHKVVRNNMYKQCNFSMFWTAEALLASYQTTKVKKYLETGKRVLDELLMTQATWQPSYMYVNVLGGFGVMNTDGEWNDSRQSLFAELILQYSKLLKSNEYRERGIAALRASFSMMYCPENPKAKEQWEKAWPFFGPADYGFTMENYGHDGRSSKEGIGIGEFTIYDWGNGAAAEAYNRIIDKFGEDYIYQ